MPCLADAYRPEAQLLSFQNDEPSPLLLHCFHISRPDLVHHHHLEPLAGLTRLSHLCLVQ